MNRRATQLLMLAAAGAALAPAGLPAAAAAKGKRAASKAPLVEVTLVTRAGTLLGPLQVRAREARLKVGSRRCTIAAGTPLAALAALQAKKAAGVPALKATDYSGCGSKPSSSNGLYLRAVGKERAAGPDGWIYDVNGRRGTSGAADSAGPFGTGKRLKNGQRVNWRWCHADTDPDGGCGPELRLSLPAKANSAQPLAVQVQERAGADGEEVTVAARAGITVIAQTLGGAELTRTVTAAGGTASLALPAGTAGRVRVIAELGKTLAPAGRLVVVSS